MFWLELLSALDTDDQDFVLKIYNDYSEYMYRRALEKLGRSHDAEDAVNDIMLKIMNYIEKYKGQNDVMIRNQIVIYIRSIVRNTLKNMIKEENRRLSHYADMFVYDDDQEEMVEMELADGLYDLEDIIITREEIAESEKVLLQMGEDFQDAVNLVYMCGYTSGEAADILNTTPGNVRWRLYKARNTIKEAAEKKNK